MAEFPHDTVKLIQQALTKYGLTSTILQSGILAVVSTEGSFYPKDEISWKNTPVSRIRIYFADRVKHLTDAQLDAIKKDDRQFFELVYGYQTTIGKSLGNTLPGDGYKYIGRGFNGITGKKLYEKYGNAIGVDLVNNPARLNELPVAAAALAVYFSDNFKNVLSRFGLSNPNQVKDLETATRMSFQVNAGPGTNIDANAGLREEFQKQLVNVKKLYELARTNPGKTGGLLALLLFGLGTALFFLNRENKN